MRNESCFPPRHAAEGHHHGHPPHHHRHGLHRHPGPDRAERRLRAGGPGADDATGGGDRGGHHGRHHGGRFGGRRGGGRALGHGDLKLLLLALIEQQPRHGYELIRTITEMFNGQYTPSPGSIYPTLTLLEEMELVESEAGARKQYSITEAGRRFLAGNRELVDAMRARTQSSARMAARMSLPQDVRDAMEQLKRALLSSTTGWSEAETQRVADIVADAAARIVQGRAQD